MRLAEIIGMGPLDSHSVWELYADGDRHLRVEDSVVDVNGPRFIGQSLAAYWSAPATRIVGKKRPLPDFLSWKLSAPVLSMRAVEALRPIVGTAAEFLPLIEIRNVPFFVMNVTLLVDCLDIERSDVTFRSDQPDRVLNVFRHVFLPERLPGSPIFKVVTDPGLVFVSRPFVEVVIAHRLSGARFADPGANNLVRAFAGKDLNVLPEAAF